MADLFLLLLTLLAPAFVADYSNISEHVIRTADLRLAGDGRFAELTFEARAGDVVTITARGEALDVVLDVLGPEGDRLAYNDDWAGGQAVESGDPALAGLSVTDAAAVRLPVSVDGALIVRVNTFNGEGAGDVAVEVWRTEPLTVSVGETVWAPIPSAGSVQVSVEADEGPFTITVSDASGQLDPVAQAFDAAGVLIAANDDHAGVSLDLNRFDAAVRVRQAGRFDLRITEFMGRAGWVKVQVALD